MRPSSSAVGIGCGLLLLGAGAVLVLVVAVQRESTEVWTGPPLVVVPERLQELSWEELEVLTSMRELVDAPRSVSRLPERLTLAERAADPPYALADAEEAYTPLPAAEDLHELFEHVAVRYASVHPDRALWWGVHPHPTEVSSYDEEHEAERWLLARDVRRRLAEFDVGDDAHARLDRDILLAWFDEPAYVIDDDALLGRLESWLDPLESLLVRDCCPAVERVEVVIARCDELPYLFAVTLNDLSHPRRTSLAEAVDLLANTSSYLATYPDRWEVDESARGRLRGAIDRLRGAVDEAHRRLRAMRGAATRRWPVRGDVEASLDWALGPQTDLRTEYLATVTDLETSLLERARWNARHRDEDVRFDPSPPPGYPFMVTDLRARAPEWVDYTGDEDPGLLLSEIPELWDDPRAYAYYVGPPAFAPSGPGRFLLPERPDRPEDDWAAAYQRVVQRQTALHEAYPGHHLQDALGRQACVVRRVLQSSTFVEGWATYAETIDGDSMESTLRIGSETSRALWCIADLAAHGLGAEAELIRSWVEVIEGETAPDEFRRALNRPWFHARYHIGWREVRRLVDRAREAAGPSFDRARFHRRLLLNGQVPIRFHARHLFEER